MDVSPSFLWLSSSKASKQANEGTAPIQFIYVALFTYTTPAQLVSPKKLIPPPPPWSWSSSNSMMLHQRSTPLPLLKIACLINSWHSLSLSSLKKLTSDNDANWMNIISCPPHHHQASSCFLFWKEMNWFKKNSYLFQANKQATTHIHIHALQITLRL